MRAACVPVSSQAVPRVKTFDVQLAAPKVFEDDVDDFELAASRRREAGSDIQHLVVAEVEAGDRPRGPGSRRLFFHAQHPAAIVELDHAVPLGVLDQVAEHRRTHRALRRVAQAVGKVRAIENVVAERKRNAIGSHEIASDDERLRKTFGVGLRGVFDRQSELGAVTEQPSKAVLLVRRGDDQDLADTRQHQRRDRVVDHRLVENRQQLFTDAASQRMEPRSCSSCQHYAFDHLDRSPDRTVSLSRAKRHFAITAWFRLPEAIESVRL